MNLLQFTPHMDGKILDIINAYRDDPGNPNYAFRHLLFSVTEPQYRMKASGVSEIMWEEAVRKLQDMKSPDRERLWPELVQGFKGLMQRLKIQDEVIVSDAKRLRMIQSNVKMLQRHFLLDILTWIQRMKQKEQILQQRLLRVMRIVEALEGKGFLIPLTEGEAELTKKLASISGQLNGSGANLRRKVQNLLRISRISPVQTNRMAFGGSVHLPVSTKSLADLHEVLKQQMDLIAKLSSILKREIRHVKIMRAQDTQLKMGIQSELVQ